MEGVLENTSDTVAMLKQSRPIAVVDSVVFLSALLVNIAGVHPPACKSGRGVI